MKKLIPVLFAALAVNAAAYNPPPGGENYPLLGHPALLLNAGSAAGGGIFNAGPYSAGINPALLAGIQRVSADFAYAGIIGENYNTDDGEGEGHLGHVFNLALLAPSRWGVFSGGATTLISPPDTMPLRSTLAIRAAFARDITENFYVGASLFSGFAYEFDDIALALDLGAFFRLGKIGILKEARLGVALANLGKTFKVDYAAGDEVGYVPGFVTARVGFAATLLEAKAFSAGFSTDIAAPTFQNLWWSLGLQAMIANVVTLSAGWDLNLREYIESNDLAKAIHSPFVGLAIKISMNMGDSEFMKSRGWQQSDLAISGVGQKLHDDVWLFSAGATANFGLKDTKPPVIDLWNGEEE